MTDIAYSAHDPAAGLTLHDALKAGTRQQHRELERALDLLRPDFTLGNYRRLLVQYYGFYLPFERFLDERAGEGSVAAQFYCRDRRKRRLLESDLRALDVEIASYEGHIPDERIASLFSSEDHLLGAVYVIEGSMLGGAILSKHFMKRLRLAPETGLRFFSGYGGAAKEKWLATLQLLQDRDQDNLSRRAAIDGARRMFQLLGQQLLDESVLDEAGFDDAASRTPPRIR